MKILMYSVRPDEEAAVKAWAERHDVTVDTNQEVMSLATVDLAKGYDGVVIVQHGVIDSDQVYEKLHSFGIKQLGLRSAGYDVVDLKAAAANDLIVTNVPAYSPRSVAEYSLAQLMRLIRNLEIADERAQQQDFRWGGLVGREIHDLTIGIIGAGRIGSTAAKLYKALGATVLANDPVPRDDMKDIATYVDKATILKESDVIDLHPDLNPSSTHLLAAADFKLMKNSAYLINASRGPVVDTPALIAALKQHEIAGAAIDAVEGEEVINNFDLRDKTIESPEIKALIALPNAIYTPHIAFYTTVSVQNMVDISLDDAFHIITTGKADHPVQA